MRVNKLKNCFWALLFLTLTPSQAAAELEPVTLQLKWHHQFQFAGYYAAKAKGYYAEAGLDVDILEAKPNLDPVSEVVNGKADYGVGSNSLVLAYNADKPVKVLAVIFQHSPYVLLAKKESGISNIHDVAGKRLMLEPIADELVAYLKNEGVDLSLVQQVPHSFKVMSLIDGDTDVMSAYITDEPFFLDRQDIPYSAFSPRATGIDFYGDNLFTSDAEIELHPERVAAFRAASLKGWEYALSHPDEIIELILSQYPYKTINREKLNYEAVKMMTLIHPELIKIGYMLPERWQHIASTYADLGMLPKDIDLTDFIYAPDAEVDLSHWYWLIAIASLIILIISTIAWHFLRMNKSLDNLLYLKNQQENIGEAINHIAHQWKQPLNNLGLQLMRIEQIAGSKNGDHHQIKTLATQGQDTLEFMADTVDTFNGFLSTKKVLSRFTPDTVVEKTLALLKDNLERNSITVIKQLASDVQINVSESEFSHVLLTLIINARDAMLDRGINNAQIHLETMVKDNRMVLTLADNAGGILIKPINSIFNMGVSTKTNPDVGVGLFIVKKIVTKSWGGSINASNNKDGAIFTITVPLAQNT